MYVGIYLHISVEKKCYSEKLGGLMRWRQQERVCRSRTQTAGGHTGPQSTNFPLLFMTSFSSKLELVEIDIYSGKGGGI